METNKAPRGNVYIICKNTGKSKFYKVAGKEHPAFVDSDSEYCLMSCSVVAAWNFYVIEIPANLAAFRGNKILLFHKI